METANTWGYKFFCTSLFHPRFRRLTTSNRPATRTDYIIQGQWVRFVVGKMSPWIDCDSPKETLRRKSCSALSEELQWGVHLGIPVIMLDLIQEKNVNLARLLVDVAKSERLYIKIWVVVPMSNPLLSCKDQPLKSANFDVDDEGIDVYDDLKDPWHWWTKLYTLCGGILQQNLSPVLELSANLPPAYALKRWYAEPIKAVVVPTHIFFTNRQGFPVLSRPHQDIIKEFFKLDIQVIVKGACRHERGMHTYVQYITWLYANRPANSLYQEHSKDYSDFLQEPLQPLADNLSSSTYEVFEMDPYKYAAYEKAVCLALKDRVPDAETDTTVTTIMVLGAGRGPLVQKVLAAAFDSRRKVKVFAVEKNRNALITLRNRVMEEWGDDVTVVESDMRDLETKIGCKADIFVSELLGSFGDNELSPECLDGAQPVLKPDGISIPFVYTSYMAPLQSSRVYNEVTRQRDPEKPYYVFLESPYLVNLVNCQLLADPQPVFTFRHPNWDLTSNERYIELTFNITHDSTLHGFAGFFDSMLYRDINMSIVPNRHSPDMFSWFPVVFPLMYPIHVRANDRVTIHIWRVVTSSSVWYEWTITEPIVLPIHNGGGRAATIGLAPRSG